MVQTGPVMTAQNESCGERRRAETASIDNRLSGSGVEAAVQAGSIHQVSIAEAPRRRRRPGETATGR